MPNIDGKTEDWNIVGEDYTYRTERLDGRFCGHGDTINTKDIDVSVKVGWVKGLNRLYFLYEAYDDYWDFGLYSEERGYQNDIFEISLDADLSGGPFINNRAIEDSNKSYLNFAGVHAQNYHIFTPPINNQWVMIWGGNSWISSFPWSHQAYDYSFRPGESGKLVLEFWITPFNYAPSTGPDDAVVTNLEENELIALSWAILDFDNGRKDGPNNCNLAHNVASVQDASALCAFRLMPIEPKLLPAIEANFSLKVIDMDRRLVYFKDESIGQVEKRLWHFGDGTTSTEQHPIHQYERPGTRYNVLLEIEGPGGTSRFSKHWEVNLK